MATKTKKRSAKRRKDKTKVRITAEAVGQPSRLIGPEDVRPGLWVTVNEQTYRLPDLCGDKEFGDGELGTLTWTGPSYMTGVPLRVRAVSLPFVLCTEPDGDPYEIDLRRHRLAWVDPSYGESARRAAKRS